MTTSPGLDYTALALDDVRRRLEDVARDANATFGGLTAQQLNWGSGPAQWSVGQCFEHLLTANRLMLGAAEHALDARQPRTMWQRLPMWPALLGRMLIRSQAPTATRKFKAPSQAQPAVTNIAADVIQRFVEQHRDAVAWMQRVDEGTAARTVMTSPFIRIVTYSVLDGCRLMVAHDHRHFEQARRVMQSPGFPRS